MDVEKRDGRVVPFNRNKITNAVLAAFKEVEGDISEYAQMKAENIADYIESIQKDEDRPLTVEEIGDYTERGLMSCKAKDVAKAYILYREERTRFRGNSTDKEVLELLDGKSDY